MLILGFPEYLPQAERLATVLNIQLQEVALHQFPDGESLLRLPIDLPEHVVICRSLNQPNDKLIELLLCAKTAREQGVKRLTLVAPYLCYMRQDIANQPQAIPIENAISLSATEEIGLFLKQQFDHAVLLGPDSESKQWVAAIAKKIGFDYSVAEKVRLGDTQVTMTLADYDFHNKAVVIIDDMASTGRTLAKATSDWLIISCRSSTGLCRNYTPPILWGC